MDINENGVPEKMDADLSDIAYNKVPEGAEYDVFSENVKNSERGVLLYNDIPSADGNDTKAGAEIKQESSVSSAESIIKRKLQSVSAGDGTSEGADDSSENGGMQYDVFSENFDPDSVPKREINREYLDTIYEGGLEIPEDTIFMKRSDYISEFNKIEENYRETKKECLKDCLIVLLMAVFFVILNNFLSYLHDNISSFVVTNVLTMAVIASKLGSIIICAVLLISIIKKIIKAKKARQKSLELLERKKKDFMLMGLYDLSN